MLTEENAIIFELLSELDDTCRKLELSYFLSPKLTLNAVLNLGMPLNPGSGRILMKAEDMESLRKYLSEHLEEGRALESMMDGGHFPGFFLRYENLHTLYLTPNQGSNFRYPSMFVDIYPIRPGVYKTLGRRLNLLEEGWRSSTFDLKGYPFRKEQALTLPVRFAARMNRQKVGPWIYQRLLTASIWKERKNCFYRVHNTNATLPAILFEEVGEVTLEGRSFLAPADTDLYLTSAFGEDYREMGDSYKPSPNIFISPLVSASSYLDSVGGMQELEDYGKQKKAAFLRKRRIQRFRNNLDRGWFLVKDMARERQIEAYYQERKELIKTYFENQDFRRLENAFIPYHRLMKKVVKQKRLPALDAELMPIYVATLIHTGNFANLAKVQRILSQEEKLSEANPVDEAENTAAEEAES